MITGSAKDFESAGISDTEASITGTVRNEAIAFCLQYLTSDPASFSVLYNGYYSPFRMFLLVNDILKEQMKTEKNMMQVREPGR